MAPPLRGTQSLVGQMGWVTSQRLLLAMELAWRWIFGLPFLAVCWIQFQKLLIQVPPESAGLNALDAQNPWVAAAQLVRAWTIYRPHVVSLLEWLAPAAALAWVIVSALGRSLVLRRLALTALTQNSAQTPHAPSMRAFGARVGNLSPDQAAPAASAPPQVVRFRPLSMIGLQAAWLVLLGTVWFCWFRSIEWAAATHMTAGDEPDLIGFACWAIFLSLGFFTLWALVSWAVSVAPLLMLLEDRSAPSALAHSFHLGKDFTAKLIEINMVMGIVNLALIVLAMVFSAAPLPFGDELGPTALHLVDALAILFYLIASDYFQLVRLKGFEEFWKMFRRPDGPGALKAPSP